VLAIVRAMREWVRYGLFEAARVTDIGEFNEQLSTERMIRTKGGPIRL
jgi:hypothetical protein